MGFWIGWGWANVQHDGAKDAQVLAGQSDGLAVIVFA